MSAEPVVTINGAPVNLPQAVSAIADLIENADKGAELNAIRQCVEAGLILRCHMHFPKLGRLKHAAWEARFRKTVLRRMRNHLHDVMPTRVDPDDHDAILAVCERFLRHCTWSEPVSEDNQTARGEYSGWHAHIRVTVHRNPVVSCKGGILPQDTNKSVFSMAYDGRDIASVESIVELRLSPGNCVAADDHVTAGEMECDSSDHSSDDDDGSDHDYVDDEEHGGEDDDDEDDDDEDDDGEDDDDEDDDGEDDDGEDDDSDDDDGGLVHGGVVSWTSEYNSSSEALSTIVRGMLTMIKQSGTLRFLLEEEEEPVAAAAAGGGQEAGAGLQQRGGSVGGSKRGRSVMSAMIVRLLLGELLIFKDFEVDGLNLLPGLCGTSDSKTYTHDDETNQQLYDACPPPAPPVHE